MNKKNIYNLSLYFRWIFKIFDVLYNFLSCTNQDKVKILMYHSVGGNLNLELNIEKEIFIEQLEYLQSKGEIISIHESIQYFNQKKKRGDKNYFVITFDDGYSNFFTKVFPELSKRSIPATLFPALEFIDKPRKKPLMKKLSSSSWDYINPLSLKQLEKLHKSKLITIGSHGYFHKNYSKLSSKEINLDIKKSDDWFLNNLDFKPDLFCYPMGHSNKSSESIIRRNFLYAFKASYTKRADSLYLKETFPRLPILRSDGMFWFKIRISGYLYRDHLLIRYFIRLLKI